MLHNHHNDHTVLRISVLIIFIQSSNNDNEILFIYQDVETQADKSNTDVMTEKGDCIPNPTELVVNGKLDTPFLLQSDYKMLKWGTVKYYR